MNTVEEVAAGEEGERGMIRRVKIMERGIAIGFSGSVLGGLVCSAKGDRLFYPLGSSVVVRPLDPQQQQQQKFLRGHTHKISCLHISSSGKYLATGETDEVGSKVEVIVWDIATCVAVGSHRLHHAAVAALQVSPSDRFIASAGGADDASIVLWDVNTRTPLCVGKRCHGGRPFVPTCLSFLWDDVFFAGGRDCVQVWRFAEETRKLTQSTASMGKIKRTATVMLVCENSDGDGYFILLGTESGDIVKFCVSQQQQQQELCLVLVGCAVKRTVGKNKLVGVTAGKFSGGVTSLLRLKSDEFLVGSGDGGVCLVRYRSTKSAVPQRTISQVVQEPTRSCLQELRSTILSSTGGVTSLCQPRPGTTLVGCTTGQMFLLDTLTFAATELSASHTGRIRDLAFPRDIDRILGSCGDDGIRLWDILTGRQVFHSSQSSSAATCLLFSPDGSAVLAGFADGGLRAFTPQTGKLLFHCPGAHPAGVSALANVRGGLVTGSEDGQVRSWLWPKASKTPRLVFTVREHKRGVTNLEVTSDQSEFLSGSRDGTCIVWDLNQSTGEIKRKRILCCSSSLVWAKYHPTECQILTLSMDGQLSYWEVINGQEIRTLEVEKHGAATAMDVAKDGESIVVAGKDSQAKMWRYRQGDLTHLGRADCGEITRILMTAAATHIVAATKYGAIVTWETGCL